MAYKVKKLAAISGVSVRTLHFYDEVDLVKPAHHPHLPEFAAAAIKIFAERELC